jgi:orotidine-5'-phosphate decarboxylase
MLAEMTTESNMVTGVYSTRCIRAAEKHSDFVVGFVANGTLADSVGYGQDFLVFTTGVNRVIRGDTLGQQYQTPEEAVTRGSDVIIVGRGIYGEADPLEAAKLYKKDGWIAYEKRLGSS